MGTVFINNYNVKRNAKGGMRVVKVKKSRETPQNHGGHMPEAPTQFTTEGTFTLTFIKVRNPVPCRRT